MADTTALNPSRPSIDPTTGFCSATNTFHSVRPTIPLPPLAQPLSSASFAFSLLASSPFHPSTTAVIDSVSGLSLSYSDFILRTRALSSALQTILSKGHTAFTLAPPSVHVPVLYFSLLSLGVVVSPSNPISTPSDISRQIHISRPAIAFATSATASKLPPSLPRILLDSPRFLSMINGPDTAVPTSTAVFQSDNAAILYSSGTTGNIKGVVLTHRNLISVLAGMYAIRQNRQTPAVLLASVPLFHVFGFCYCIKAVAVGETLVLMERPQVEKIVKAVDEFRVTHMAVAPPVVVAMTKGNAVDPYRMESLEWVGCGGAPLRKEAIEKFKAKFPAVELAQGYGLTETSGGVFRTNGPDETCRHGSVGRISAYCEAKIVDTVSGSALPLCRRGELWIRGATVMKGYFCDEAANATVFDSEGWLKTGDICYIDKEGFLYVVDRLKELIKYKGYQVPPAELEGLLQSHPEIVDAAVIPYPDEEAGQVPMAFVVRRTQSNLDPTQVMDFISKQVAPYKKIRRISFIDSIPKDAAGKILRKDLVKIATLITVASKL